MFLPFLEGNLFCGPLSRTEWLNLRREKQCLVQIYRKHCNQKVGHSKKILITFCFFTLKFVHSIYGTVSSGANEILEGCCEMNLYLWMSGSPLSSICF